MLKIARLVPAVQPTAGPDRQPDLGEGRDKPKSYAQQAKMLAKDEDFQRFLSKDGGPYIGEEQHTETYIECFCEVNSCAKIIEGTDAGKKFKQLQAKFLEWRDRE